jgi:hypothetical protein
LILAFGKVPGMMHPRGGKIAFGDQSGHDRRSQEQPPDDMKLKKLRKNLPKIYAEQIRLLADLKASLRQAKSKVASGIESPPAT